MHQPMKRFYLLDLPPSISPQLATYRSVPKLAVYITLNGTDFL